MNDDVMRDSCLGTITSRAQLIAGDYVVSCQKVIESENLKVAWCALSVRCCNIKTTGAIKKMIQGFSPALLHWNTGIHLEVVSNEELIVALYNPWCVVIDQSYSDIMLSEKLLMAGR